MIIKVGGRVQNNFTGKVYEVKLIENEWVLLEGEEGLNQVLTEIKCLNDFYKKIDESSQSGLPLFGTSRNILPGRV